MKDIIIIIIIIIMIHTRDVFSTVDKARYDEGSALWCISIRYDRQSIIHSSNVYRLLLSPAYSAPYLLSTISVFYGIKVRYDVVKVHYECIIINNNSSPTYDTLQHLSIIIMDRYL